MDINHYENNMTIYKPILALNLVLGSYVFSVCKVLFSHNVWLSSSISMLQWFITLNQRKRLKPVVAQRPKEEYF